MNCRFLSFNGNKDTIFSYNDRGEKTSLYYFYEEIIMYSNYENGFINRNNSSKCHEEQKHVHEVLGSVEIAEREEDPHNHRFATVSGEAIKQGMHDHVHDVRFRTDFYENHFHEFSGRTGGAIKVGDRHVHFLESVTTQNDGHRHKFRVGTLINDPIGEEE